jgi:RNA polymerase sigma-70 factor (ECF subfamily)
VTTSSDAPRQEVERLFREHGAFVLRALRRMGLDPHEADDLRQDVFCVVSRRLGDFEARSSMRTWLYGICAKVALAHKRRASTAREIATADVADDLATTAGPYDDLAAEEARQLLASALAELDEEKRLVFVLYEIEGRAMSEVAREAKCPLQTAYSRLHAARARVEARLRRATRVEYRAILLAALHPAGAASWLSGLRGASAPAATTAAAAAGTGTLAAGPVTKIAVAVAIAAGAAGGTWSAVRAPAVHAPAPVVVASAPVRVDARPAAVPAIASTDPAPPPSASAAARPVAPPREPSEVELLGRAQDTLDSDPGAALDFAARHARRYPRGALAQEREVLAIDALLRLGRRADAEERAARFDATFPGSPHRRRIDVLLARKL